MGTLYVEVTQIQICRSAFVLDGVLVPDFYVNDVRFSVFITVEKTAQSILKRKWCCTRSHTFLTKNSKANAGSCCMLSILTLRQNFILGVFPNTSSLILTNLSVCFWAEGCCYIKQLNCNS